MMSKVYLFVVVVFTLVLSTFGGRKEDFQKILGAEEMLMETKMKNIVSYAYRTKVPFAQLKTKIGKYLGTEWRLMPLPEAQEKSLKDKMKNSGKVYIGFVNFIQAKDPTKMLTFTALKDKEDQEDYFVSVVEIN